MKFNCSTVAHWATVLIFSLAGNVAAFARPSVPPVCIINGSEIVIEIPMNKAVYHVVVNSSAWPKMESFGLNERRMNRIRTIVESRREQGIYRTDKLAMRKRSPIAGISEKLTELLLGDVASMLNRPDYRTSVSPFKNSDGYFVKPGELSTVIYFDSSEGEKVLDVRNVEILIDGLAYRLFYPGFDQTFGLSSESQINPDNLYLFGTFKYEGLIGESRSVLHEAIFGCRVEMSNVSKDEFVAQLENR